MTGHPPVHSHRQDRPGRLRAALGGRSRSRHGAPARRSWQWRLLAPAVFVLAGVLFVTSMVSSQGTDLRAGRYDDLPGLADSEAHDLEGLRAQAVALSAQVDRLSKELGSTAADTEQRKADALEGPAGLRPVRGPGVTITLDDASDEALAEAGSQVSQLLVHQQDIQAVANALWAGGAEAMTLQGQRVVATTGIKCVGNTVVLHGVPYSPPYRITAVGSPSDLLASVEGNPYVKLYLQAVQDGLGWDVKLESSVRLPAYDGSTELDYARPATTTARR